MDCLPMRAPGPAVYSRASAHLYPLSHVVISRASFARVKGVGTKMGWDASGRGRGTGNMHFIRKPTVALQWPVGANVLSSISLFHFPLFSSNFHFVIPFSVSSLPFSIRATTVLAAVLEERKNDGTYWPPYNYTNPFYNTRGYAPRA